MPEVPPHTASMTASWAARLQSAWANAKQFAGRGLAALSGTALLSSLIRTHAQYHAIKADTNLPSAFMLDMDLGQHSIVELAPTTPLAVLQPGAANKVELHKLVRALQLAAKDERVKGVIAHLAGPQNLAGFASVQELRAAVQAFRQAAGGRGAVTVVHAASFGEAGANGTLPYYLATAFDKVYMQSSGLVGLLGLESRLLFLRGLLDKLKVVPLFWTREDYKTAAHMLTQRDLTPQHKENTEAILKCMVNQVWQGIAAGRGLSALQLAAAVDAAPLMAETAAIPADHGGYGLLDGVKYVDEVLSSMQVHAGPLNSHAAANQPLASAVGGLPLPRVPILKYLIVKEMAQAARMCQSWTQWLSQKVTTAVPSTSRHQQQQPHMQAAGCWTHGAGTCTAETAGWVPRHIGQGKPKVAVIHAVGPILQGPVQGPPGPLNAKPGKPVIDASKLSAQLAQLADAADVAAVVLRLNTPGGSALGSDTLHHVLCLLRSAGKSVVVSCGDMTASGGMYTAVAADYIVAQPGTLTGSVGVALGKVDMSGMVQNLGITASSVAVGGPNLTLQSPWHRPDKQQEAKINHLMDCIYEQFVSKVASGRGMTREAVKKLAGGRVYTGEQALQAGLVDELGGLTEAIAAAKRLAKLPSETDAVVVFDYPARRMPLHVRLLQRGMVSPPEGTMLHALLDGGQHMAMSQTQALSTAMVGGSIAGHLFYPDLHMYGAEAMSLLGSPAVGGQLGQMLQVVNDSIASASMLEGQICCYAMDVQLLCDSLV